VGNALGNLCTRGVGDASVEPDEGFDGVSIRPPGRFGVDRDPIVGHKAHVTPGGMSFFRTA
jgi:hypothetical protein